ncbi:SDR family NAD(P)-dependent oxidoreductase [Comamonas flocculans]|uniref:SDR family NAD(P)-dependent oxidoreductase n=1 Tax=Comamonas flocculans TaxID=2597701 RepID=A0A5B8RSI6_9BURK|nr:SDR family NAD(P)-dependent oxidoreductase [Comamonas flocculans]QEA11684.1 SDR family NAD(P)-dependent oxidoreductase [Comamonas flocculans]
MSASHLYILTGASRGLGLALARELLQPGHCLVLIARSAAPGLHAPPGAQLTQWQHDLGDARAAAQQLGQWLAQQPPGRHASATLINNAGALAQIAPLRECAQAPAQASIANALRVGLEAPMLLSASFLGATAEWPGARKVLNISSGLGRRPMAAQAAYCAAKAGMDHFSRCLALEEAARPNGARVCSLAPGVIDTDMQLQLRSADPAHFPDQPRFARLNAQEELSSAGASAARVLAWLRHPAFGREPVADVRSLDTGASAMPQGGPSPAGARR